MLQMVSLKWSALWLQFSSQVSYKKAYSSLILMFNDPTWVFEVRPLREDKYVLWKTRKIMNSWRAKQKTYTRLCFQFNEYEYSIWIIQNFYDERNMKSVILTVYRIEFLLYSKTIITTVITFFIQKMYIIKI